MVSVLSNGIENLKWSGSIKSVEDEVRRLINARNVRLTEYFKDFDRLRTGFISKNQFDRCLDQLFGVVLSAEEDSLLMEKYGSDPKQKGMVNYRKFCEVIGAVFNPNELQEDPATQSIGVDASAPTDRRPLSPASLSKCDELLRRMAVHYKYHGINIKTCYADFDKHHIGVVTEPQFYRSFPGPPDITDGEVKLLGKKYRDPARPGLCNYYNFHFDIENKQRDLQDEADFTKFAPNQDNNNLGSRGPGTPTLDDIFEKIRVAVFKNGIRTTEFFCDHDKLRSGIITENQFICGLTLCCGSQANLSRNEIQKVVDAFKTDDGRVVYKEFCDMMENTFTLRDLEKQPTADPYRPPVGALAKAPNLLSNAEEARVQEILKGLIDKVRKRRLMVYPYFKDYDRSKGYTRGVTKTQFARLLHFLSLDLQPRELELICKKYEYPVGGDINYPAFSQAIDSEYTGTSTTLGNDAENGRKTSPVPKQRDVDLSTVNPEELIGRIRYHVLVNRLRVEEFFQDFDPLRHGSISKGQFRQCLNSLGLNLTEAQFEVLSLYYEDQKRPGNTMWTRFLTDVEIDFDKHNNGHVTKSQARQCLLNLGLTNTEQEMKIERISYEWETDGTVLCP
ncbi:hypothetical protein AC249_AIPGENE16872 [Exaiptasia diaphana]|nr:hypothetical protein AC249_AIPGENE16872 [Exaiptasia diaphana]